MSTFHQLVATDIQGKSFPFVQLQGKKVMLVNTASACGFTPQYAQLQELYQQFGPEKLVILAFPSNDFGAQEQGTDDAIQAFCEVNYGVTFPLMQKVKVHGDDSCEVYKWVTQKAMNGVADIDITWNFQKILVNEEGVLIRSISPGADPFHEDILSWLTQTSLF